MRIAAKCGGIKADRRDKGGSASSRFWEERCPPDLLPLWEKVDWRPELAKGVAEAEATGAGASFASPLWGAAGASGGVEVVELWMAIIMEANSSAVGGHAPLGPISFGSITRE